MKCAFNVCVFNFVLGLDFVVVVVCVLCCVFVVVVVEG